MVSGAQTRSKAQGGAIAKLSCYRRDSLTVSHWVSSDEDEVKRALSE